MTTSKKRLMAAVLLLGAGALALPALAQSGGGVMGGNGGMMGGMGGMMGRGMGKDCMQMMHGMPGGERSGRPNDQWRQRTGTPDRG